MKEYKEACHKLLQEFTKRYYKNPDIYWVADELGVVSINDEFYSIHDMYEYLKYKYSSKKMFEHYYYAVECGMRGESPVNIKNYKKMK